MRFRHKSRDLSCALVCILLCSLGFVLPHQARADALSVVDRMIDAHGGMQAWSSAPSVYFVDTFLYPDGRTRSSRVLVEQGRRRSTFEVVDSSARMAWDGERAWSLHWDSPAPPRFVAQLNYYFLNLPWLTRDPGVHLVDEGLTSAVGIEGEVHAVRMTFGEGVGDSPDDYYVLFIDPVSHRLRGCEYVVTYAPLLPPGAKHTPVHVLAFDGYDQVDGLLVPAGFTIRNLDGSVYVSCTVSDWDFGRTFDPSLVEMPEGAVVDTSLD